MRRVVCKLLHADDSFRQWGSEAKCSYDASGLMVWGVRQPYADLICPPVADVS